MLIACKCLNIILKSIDDHLPSTTSATISDYDDITIRTKTTIGLPSYMVSSTNDNFEDNRHDQSPFLQNSTVDQLKSDQLQFFKTAKQLTDTAIEPSIQHPSLVNVIPIGNWNLHSCRHCNMISHAESINSNKLLINPMLWTTPEKITSLKMQRNFSKSFNILLMSTKPDPKQFETHENDNIRTKQLRQYLSNAIQVETDATEERIDQFTKQQMTLLKMFREQAENDYQNVLWALNRNISNTSDNEANADETLFGSLGTNSKLLSDLTPPVTPDSTPMSIGNSPTFKQQTSFFMISQNSMHKKQNPTNKMNHSVRTVQSSTPRDDIFFDMDGLDGFDSRDASMPDNDDDDDDGDDGDDDDENIGEEEQGFEDPYHGNRSNGIKIKPVQRKNSSKQFVAQSLPMAVPINSQRSDDEYDDYTDRQDNVDIAASIKALAKSVHGEAIFGDLPKPRFSSQI